MRPPAGRHVPPYPGGDFPAQRLHHPPPGTPGGPIVLAAGGVHPYFDPRPDPVHPGEPLPEKPILLTFDDGYESFAVYAFPLLEEFGYPAVYSVIGSWADFYSQRQEHRVRYSHTDWETLQALQQSGLVEVQNHSHDLHRLEDGQRGAQRRAGEPASAYQQRLAQDLRQLQEHCAQNLKGWQPTCFAWPFGFSSPEALPILRQLGISAALTCEERINTLTGDPEELFHLGRFNRPHGKPLEQILAAAQAP